MGGKKESESDCWLCVWLNSCNMLTVIAYLHLFKALEFWKRKINRGRRKDLS